MDVTLGGVRLQVQLALQLGGDAARVGRVLTAVDERVPAHHGQLLDDHGAGAELCRAVRGSEGGEPAADHDDVVGEIPALGQLRRAETGPRRFLLDGAGHLAGEVSRVGAGLLDRVGDGLEEAAAGYRRAGDDVHRQ